jgi:Fic family protein
VAAENLFKIAQNVGDTIKAGYYSAFLADYTIPEIEKRNDASRINELFKNYLVKKQEKQAEAEREEAVISTVVFAIPFLIAVAAAIVVFAKLRSKKLMKKQRAESKKVIEEARKRHLEELESKKTQYEKKQRALQKSLRQKEEQVNALNEALYQKREEAVIRRKAFLNEPICRYIINQAHQFNITTRDKAYDFGIALKDKDFMQLEEAVAKHYEGFDRVLLSQSPGLKQEYLTLCHLYLLGLDDSQIAALKNLTYWAIQKQKKNLQKKLELKEELAKYVFNVADGLKEAQDVAHDVAQGVAKEAPQETLQILLEIVSRNPKITREEMAKQMGVSKKTIERYLKKLEGRVRYIGSGYSGYWEVDRQQ